MDPQHACPSILSPAYLKLSKQASDKEMELTEAQTLSRQTLRKPAFFPVPQKSCWLQ